MPVMEDTRSSIEDELFRLRRELETIDKWDRTFAAIERNEDSYVARQRRRWEIILRIRALERNSTRLE
jgi:hypothetical protein